MMRAMGFSSPLFPPKSCRLQRCHGFNSEGDSGLNSPSTLDDHQFKTPVKDQCDLIEMVNNLQNKLSASGHSLTVSLPQIVVVGSQSSGKSSVLENIVGREFLPRGTGVVTRRPTVVQLYPSEEEYAVFLHHPEQKYTNFNEVRDEIEHETERKVGKHSFSSDPISIQIYSPNVLKLTLVDLPGLIKNPVGSQSESVVEEVQRMVESYVEQPHSLILAVSPANQDIANSHSLNIAKKVDPKGKRTIGVLTKLDIMDVGTDALDILENKVLPLKRGYVGVVNRSQVDIDEGKDVAYILKKEKHFFENHPSYSHIAHRMGTPYLQVVLNKQLRSHILKCLPQVRNTLFKSLSSCKTELKELTEQVGDNGQFRLPMIRLIQQFVEKLHLKLIGQSELVNLKSVSAGALIKFLVRDEMQKFLNLDIKPSDTELLIAMVNIDGFRTGVSVPSLALDALCRSLIEKYKAPLEKAVEAVSNIVVDAIEESANEVNMQPSLKNELQFTVILYVKAQEDTTKEILRNHVEAEMYYINLNHPDFNYINLNHPDFKILREENPSFSPIKRMHRNLQDNKNENSHGSGKQHCEGNKYLDAQKIMLVINFTKFELTGHLVTPANIDLFMQDCEDEIQRKKQLEATCEAISNALVTIQRF